MDTARDEGCSGQPASIVVTEWLDAQREFMGWIQEVDLAARSYSYAIIANGDSHNLVEPVKGDRQFAFMTSNNQ